MGDGVLNLCIYSMSLNNPDGDKTTQEITGTFIIFYKLHKSYMEICKESIAKYNHLGAKCQTIDIYVI